MHISRHDLPLATVLESPRSSQMRLRQEDNRLCLKVLQINLGSAPESAVSTL